MNIENYQKAKPSNTKGIRVPQLQTTQNVPRKSEKIKHAAEYRNPWILNEETIIKAPSHKKTRKKPSGRNVEQVYQNRTTHLNSVIIFTGFLAALIIVGIMTLLLPDKEISTRENRALAQFPKINAKAILSGDTSGDLDSWYSDQFPGRDSLVTMWKKIDSSLSLRFTDDAITIVEGNSDLGQGALDPQDSDEQSNPLYTSPFFSDTGGENPNP